MQPRTRPTTASTRCSPRRCSPTTRSGRRCSATPRPSRRSTPRRHRRRSSTRWYRPAQPGGRRRRRPRPRRGGRRRRRAASAGRRGGERPARPPPGAEPSSRVVVRATPPSRPTSPSGWRGARPRRRRPLRAGRRQPGARRRHVEPAVPGDPRGAGPRLLRVLVRRRSYADAGALDGLRRHRAGQACAEVLRGRRRRGRAGCWPTASPTTSSPWPRATSRARCCSASRTAAAAWPGSASSLISRGEVDPRRRARRPHPGRHPRRREAG